MCVFPDLISLEASHGTNVAKNVLENIGLENNYCVWGLQGGHFPERKSSAKA